MSDALTCSLDHHQGQKLSCNSCGWVFRAGTWVLYSERCAES